MVLGGGIFRGALSRVIVGLFVWGSDRGYSFPSGMEGGAREAGGGEGALSSFW